MFWKVLRKTTLSDSDHCLMILKKNMLCGETGSFILPHFPNTLTRLQKIFPRQESRKKTKKTGRAWYMKNHSATILPRQKRLTNVLPECSKRTKSFGLIIIWERSLSETSLCCGLQIVYL